MTIATATATTEPKFLVRFDRIWEALRRYQVCQGLRWTFLATGLALGALALADYWFELPQTARGIGLDVVGVLALVVLWYTVVVPLRWWSRPRTAAEIETRFPQLGQRIRTVVQYAGLPEELIHSEGAAPSLVAALSEETQIQARALPLDVIIPRRRAWAVAALAVIPVVAILAQTLVNPEWQTTLARLLLIDRPYTTIAVAPGDVTVEQGDNLPVSVELKGRKRSPVVLQTRPAENAKAPWLSVPLAAAASGPATRRTATLEKIRKPLVYQVVAGPAASRTSHITVRYPLAFTTFQVTLTPPSYTGLPSETVKGGDLRAVAGTEATFRMVFDALPREATLVVSEPKASVKGEEGSVPPPAPQAIPLVSDGKALTARLSITRNLDYAIVARTDDGRKLPQNGYHIDARADYPPRVGFEEPEEALEVHPIAEVLSRIRVADDFGLSKAGIVYRVNDGEEKTLVARDFTAPSAKPQAASKLEETLALEALALTSTDSVTYYAFAEDNFPGGSRRTETDLRFIDIRPFKRTYKLADGGGSEDQPLSRVLEELIARQRFNLNRTVRLAKHRPGDRTTPEDPLKIASFEELLAALTREAAEGIQGIVGEPFEALQQADAAMVAAVNALDHEKNDDASSLESEALRHLIEARRKFEFFIGQGGGMMAALRSFDRTQAQKIRKPKSKDEEAETLVAEIEELAGDEDFVYATIAALLQSETGMPGKVEVTDDAKMPPMKGEKAEASSQGREGEPEKEIPGAPKEARKGQKGQMAPRGEAPGTKKATGPGDEPKEGAGQKASDRPPMKGENGQARSRGSRKDQPGEDGQDALKQGEKKDGGGAAGTRNGMGGGDEPDAAGTKGGGQPKKKDRRAIAEEQERIAGQARDLEERLKRLEAASELSKLRMAQAAKAAERASGALMRGRAEEAVEITKGGAVLLREVARQVKGEIAREVADVVAMARDRAEELAQHEADFAEMPPTASASDSESRGSESSRSDKGMKAGAGGKDTDSEMMERLAEEARTLEQWLKQVAGRGEGNAGQMARELLEQGKMTEIIRQIDRIAELRKAGKSDEARRQAAKVAEALEAIARSLDMLHRDIVAPRLAALVEAEKRLADLSERLDSLKTDAEVDAWHRQTMTLLRELEKKEAMTEAVADLEKVMVDAGWLAAGGTWTWDAPDANWRAPTSYRDSVKRVARRIQDQIQEMILKDMMSSRDETTPPEFKELVERYYEVLSREGGGDSRRPR